VWKTPENFYLNSIKFYHLIVSQLYLFANKTGRAEIDQEPHHLHGELKKGSPKFVSATPFKVVITQITSLMLNLTFFAHKNDNVTVFLKSSSSAFHFKSRFFARNESFFSMPKLFCPS